MKAAGRNVLWILIVPPIELVLEINAKIHVQELVVQMLFVKSSITYPHAAVLKVTLEIHLLFAQFREKVRSTCTVKKRFL